MSARRLSRLVGSVLLLAALAGGVQAGNLTAVEQVAQDGTAGSSGQTTVDPDMNLAGFEWLTTPAFGAV